MKNFFYFALIIFPIVKTAVVVSTLNQTGNENKGKSTVKNNGAVSSYSRGGLNQQGDRNMDKSKVVNGVQVSKQNNQQGNWGTTTQNTRDNFFKDKFFAKDSSGAQMSNAPQSNQQAPNGASFNQNMRDNFFSSKKTSGFTGNNGDTPSSDNFFKDRFFSNNRQGPSLGPSALNQNIGSSARMKDKDRFFSDLQSNGGNNLSSQNNQQSTTTSPWRL